MPSIASSTSEACERARGGAGLSEEAEAEAAAAEEEKEEEEGEGEGEASRSSSRRERKPPIMVRSAAAPWVSSTGRRGPQKRRSVPG